MENKEALWMRILGLVDGLNRRVKEPGWSNDDIRKSYDLKDKVIEILIKNEPEEINLHMYYVPYYKYSESAKDKAGALMRKDIERKPFEYYLSLVEPGPNDIELPDKAMVEIVAECNGVEYSFHQPIEWYKAHGGTVEGMEKKAWISAPEFHHSLLEDYSREINSILKVICADII